MEDMGMNLAGAEVTLKLMEKITELESKLQNVISELNRIRLAESTPALTEGKRAEMP
jgi:hypothetical protein